MFTIAAVSVISKVRQEGSIPRLRELVLDRRQDLGAGQGQAREVDLELEAPAELRLLGDERDRAADDPRVDLLDQPEALGDVEEGGRRDVLAVRADHPQQQLMAGDSLVRRSRIGCW